VKCKGFSQVGPNIDIENKVEDYWKRGDGMKACPNCNASNPDDADFCSNCAFSFTGAPPPGQQPYPTPLPGQQPYPPTAYPGQAPVVPHYAGFWIRFVAYFVDSLVLYAAFMPLNLIFWAINNRFYVWGSWDTHAGVSAGLAFLFSIIRLVVGWAYFIWMTGRYQATLGKMLLDIKVVGPDLGPISYGTAAIRETIGKFLSAIVCGLGYIWVAFDPRKQGWMDKLANTYVIYKR
jgi:uncharacterized RDD family membrane protein YckC/ribosomal protein L40E